MWIYIILGIVQIICVLAKRMLGLALSWWYVWIPFYLAIVYFIWLVSQFSVI